MPDGRFLQLVGTFLPLFGVIATGILAAVTTGWRRWTALVAIPAATYALTTVYADVIARDGNLLFAALYLSFLLALVVYYPVLAILGAKKWLDARREATARAAATGRGE